MGLLLAVCACSSDPGAQGQYCVQDSQCMQGLHCDLGSYTCQPQGDGGIDAPVNDSSVDAPENDSSTDSSVDAPIDGAPDSQADAQTDAQVDAIPDGPAPDAMPDGPVPDAPMGCTANVVQGDVNIANSVDVSNLATVTEITGSLRITGVTLTSVVLPCLTIIGGALESDTQSDNMLATLSIPMLTEVNQIFIDVDVPMTLNLSSLRAVHHNVSLNGGAALAGLQGFSSLESVGGDFDLGATSATTLAGLQSLKTVDGNFTISQNTELTSLNGLSALMTVDGLRVTSNPKLTTLQGVASGAGLGDVFISGNGELVNLNGFPSPAPASLTISSNAKLTSIAGLAGVTSVTNKLDISNNDALTSLQGVSGITMLGALTINDNEKLGNLSGFTALTKVTGALTITNNPGFTNDVATTFRNALSPAPASTTISGNGTYVPPVWTCPTTQDVNPTTPGASVTFTQHPTTMKYYATFKPTVNGAATIFAGHSLSFENKDYWRLYDGDCNSGVVLGHVGRRNENFATQITAGHVYTLYAEQTSNPIRSYALEGVPSAATNKTCAMAQALPMVSGTLYREPRVLDNDTRYYSFVALGGNAPSNVRLATGAGSGNGSGTGTPSMGTTMVNLRSSCTGEIISSQEVLLNGTKDFPLGVLTADAMYIIEITNPHGMTYGITYFTN